MHDNQMKYGSRYNVKIFRDGDYIGSAVVRRVGGRHVESNTTMLHPKFLEEIISALHTAEGAFTFAKVKPRLGELIQRSIWEMIEQEEKKSDSSDEDAPPF